MGLIEQVEEWRERALAAEAALDARGGPARRYVVTGRYCPQDANPEKDARDVIEVGCRTLAEVEDAKLHMVDPVVTERAG
jgi:hypothetical protein